MIISKCSSKRRPKSPTSQKRMRLRNASRDYWRGWLLIFRENPPEHSTSCTQRRKNMPNQMLTIAWESSREKWCANQKDTTPEELKNWSLRTTSQNNEAQPSNEAELSELDILQALENLEKYQQETIKWRDKNIVKKNISVGDWVLRRKPNAKGVASSNPNGMAHSLSSGATGLDLTTYQTAKETSCNILGMLAASKNSTCNISM